MSVRIASIIVCLVLPEFRQTEVQNLCLSLLRNENVRRLDVAMHDALAVRAVESVQNLNREIKQHVQFEWPRFCCLTRQSTRAAFSLREAA